MDIITLRTEETTGLYINNWEPDILLMEFFMNHDALQSDSMCSDYKVVQNYWTQGFENLFLLYWNATTRSTSKMKQRNTPSISQVIEVNTYLWQADSKVLN